VLRVTFRYTAPKKPLRLRAFAVKLLGPNFLKFTPH